MVDKKQNNSFTKKIFFTLIATLLIFGVTVAEARTHKTTHKRVKKRNALDVLSSFFSLSNKKKRRGKRRYHHKRKHNKRKSTKTTLTAAGAAAVAAGVPGQDKQSDEMKIQLSLTKLGYYYSDIDGKLNGFETREAVKSMNIALSNGNAMFLDQRSREILVYLADLYRFNDILLSNIDDKKSANIKIQTALKILGCYHGKIDGLLGKDTKNCITEFEKNNNMDANGELDKREKYTLFRMAVEVNNRSIDDTKKELYKKVNQQAAKIQKLSGPADKSADKSITQKLKKPESDLEFSDSLE